MPVFYFAIRYAAYFPFTLLNHPWIIKTGVYSYAIYLMHYVVINVIEKNVPWLAYRQAAAGAGDVRDRDAVRGYSGRFRGQLFPSSAQKVSLKIRKTPSSLSGNSTSTKQCLAQLAGASGVFVKMVSLMFQILPYNFALRAGDVGSQRAESVSAKLMRNPNMPRQLSFSSQDEARQVRLERRTVTFFREP